MDLEPYFTAILVEIENHPRREELEILWDAAKFDMMKFLVNDYAKRHPGKEFQWTAEGIRQMLDMELSVADMLVDMMFPPNTDTQVPDPPT